MAETIHDISVIELEAAVRTVASSRSAHVYPQMGDGTGPACYYNRDANGEGPGHMCLIGDGIHTIGIPLDGWETYAGDVADLLTEGLDIDAEIVTFFKIVDDDEEAMRDSLRWLMQVQRAQDDGQPWGTAVSAADELRAEGWPDEDDS